MHGKGKVGTNASRDVFYINYKSFILEVHKSRLIQSWLSSCFSLSSNFIKFHDKVNKLKNILNENNWFIF